MIKKYDRKQIQEFAIKAKYGTKRDEDFLIFAMQNFIIDIAAYYSTICNLEREDLKAQAALCVAEALSKFDENREKTDFFGLCGFEAKRHMTDYVNRASRIVSYKKSRRDENIMINLNGFLNKKKKEGLTEEEAIDQAAIKFRVDRFEIVRSMNSRQSVDPDDFMREYTSKKCAYDEYVESSAMGALRDVLITLTQEERMIIDLRYLSDEKYSYKKIAEKMNAHFCYDNQTRHKVSNLHDIAMKKMKDIFEEKGIELGDLL